jgi:ribosomal-protein-alanine N-acetyltransferase
MVEVRLLEPADAAALLELRVRNRRFLEPWEPVRDEGFFTPAGQRATVRAALRERDEGRVLPFVVVHDGAVIGAVNLSGIVRGIFENAYLGYWIDEAHGGRGLMTEAVRLVATHAFGAAGLHRIQAAVIPRNTGSLRVLEKLGFREEGLAERYLRINGRWEDHKLFAVTREEWT